MKFILIPLVLLSLLSVTYSQEYGEISNEELEMTKCKEDPDADVVILLDECSIKITKDYALEILCHKRVKILTEEGKKYANVKIRYWNRDKIHNLKAASYSKDGQEFELDDDNIFEEEGEKLNTISFGIPGVTVGSVIEYQYKQWTEYVTRLPIWIFQDKNFTKLSILKIVIPQGFVYNTVKLNFTGYDIKQEMEEVDDYSNGWNKAALYKWTARNLPGIKNEPFVENLDDKYAKMIFILDSYKNLYVNIDFSKTWNSAVEKISEKYDDLIKQDGITKNKALELVKNENDNLKKVQIIYDFVKSEIKAADHTSIFGDDFKEPEDVFETKEGSASEKNMLLINMLRNIGLNAKPVLISTRENGTIVSEFKEIYQFNRLICKLNVDNKDYFLYAGSKYNPFGYLTPSTDVGVGLLIDGEIGKIIYLKPTKPFNKTEYKTDCTLNSEDTFEANSTISYFGYSAYLKRNSIEDKNQENLKDDVKEILKDINAAAVLDSFYYEDTENIENPLKLNITYTIPDYINDSGDLIYFPIPLFSSITSNPFQKEKRLFDVDFDFAELISEEIKLNIPSNLKLVEVPNKSKSSIDKYSFSKYYFSTNDYVNCSRIQNIQSKKFSIDLYPKLKDLYSEMIASDQDQLVFKKVDLLNTANKGME
jgi:hypothetical protein